MALDKEQLEEDLLKAMKGMGSDDDFSKGVPNAIKTYAENGVITTVDSGEASSGSFSGTGVGSIEIDIDKCQSSMISACLMMIPMQTGGDAVLALGMGNGIDSMVKAGKVKTKVSGTITTKAGISIPVSGADAEGTFSGDIADLISGLNDTFKTMREQKYTIGFDGDAYFAEKLAGYVDDYFKKGKASTKGQGTIEGAEGTGTIS